ncbi:hypothetical protein KJ586_04940 [Patescibacteria group bacterium]|nr:hypothetical protein [Patescibacteria group bacterium]
MENPTCTLETGERGVHGPVLPFSSTVVTGPKIDMISGKIKINGCEKIVTRLVLF